MNTQHIHELTLRLCQGLDQNYDVVNMDSVMAVISSLEGSPVTKEQLEATRLAKFINHLRRRTKDENLARRAKSLLKKWREMVGIQQQQVVDITQVKPLTGLTSVAGLNTKLYGQYHTLRPRKETVEKAMNFDANHHSSNSNSNQINNVPAVTSAISDVILSLTNITSDPIMSTEISQVQQRDDKSQGQYNFSKSGATARNGMQPTSFENVLSCFGVTENMSVIGEGFTNEKANKSELQLRPYNSNTYIIDHSSHSNSEKSRSPYITPDVIDIQDSNSCSNLSTLIPNKTSSTGITTCLAKTVFSLCSKSKKVKKEKKRKEKNDYSKTNIDGGIKDTSILLNDTLSNHAHPPPPGENIEKLDELVYKEKFQSTNAEIPSLLDNSSMCSMFLPEGSTNTTEQIKNQASLDLSKTDLTFSGKFKKTKSAISTPSNILFCQNTQVQGHQAHLPCAENTQIQPEYDSETAAIALKALPRKRGRKKGSKGVDSIIAKEGGRTSQRLITLMGNGNKKVKTTRELYAEMQNRKMGAKSAMSPPILGWAALQQQKETSRPTSSGSVKVEKQSRYNPNKTKTNESELAETIPVVHNVTVWYGASISSIQDLDELSSLLRVPLVAGRVNRCSDVLGAVMEVNDWISFVVMSSAATKMSVIECVFKSNHAQPTTKDLCPPPSQQNCVLHSLKKCLKRYSIQRLFVCPDFL